MEKFDGTSNICNKLHYVIAEFVPVTFDARSSFTHAKLEQDNILGLDLIVYWEDANTAITTGMFIKGKHTNIWKMLTELKRCLKCQKYGHYVSDCKATGDTCARCAEHHCTAQCTVNKIGLYHFTNCTGNETTGHGAVDRECMVFKGQHWEIQECIPENKYKFFPTSAPQTWKLLSEPEPHPECPQPMHQQNNYQKATPEN